MPLLRPRNRLAWCERQFVLTMIAWNSQFHHEFSLKAAVDSEFADWMENRSTEDWVNVQGLPRLSEMSGHDWQVEVKRQLRDLVKTVQQANRVNFQVDILYVVNPIRHRTTGPTCYNVHLGSVEQSRRLRELYSGFFRQNNPVKLPKHLKGVSLRAMLTLNTRIRLAIMRQLGANYKASNPGGSFKVRGYGSRPDMVIMPPAKAASSRPRKLTFIQAATSLPAIFQDESLILIYQAVGQSNRGKLRQLFIVLNDDDHDRCLDMVKKHHKERRAAGRSRSGPGGDRRDSTLTHSVTFSEPGGGMDVDDHSELVGLLRQPPPKPPPTPGESPTGVKSTSVSKSDVEKARDSLKRPRLSETESDSSVEASHRGRASSASSSESASSSDSSSSSGSSSDSSASDRKSSKSKSKSKSKSRSKSSKSKGRSKSKSKPKKKYKKK